MLPTYLTSGFMAVCLQCQCWVDGGGACGSCGESQQIDAHSGSSSGPALSLGLVAGLPLLGETAIQAIA